MKTPVVCFFAMLCCFAQEAWAQLPLVKAQCGEGRNIDWPKKHKEHIAWLAENDGPNEFVQGNCSQGVLPLRASSVLKPQGSKQYGTANLNDDDPMTAWVEGVSGYGTGEWFEVEGITVNIIYNGYQSTPANWLNNSRVKRFKVYMNGKPLCLLDLTDEMGAQRFELPHHPDWAERQLFRFEIVDVYKGEKWDDVAVSLVDHVACCFATGTQVWQPGGENTDIGGLAAGNSVLSPDPATGTLQQAQVLAVAKQAHVKLLHIATASYSLRLTPWHPLYVKGRGFVSLSRLLADKPYGEYGSLLGLEVMVWDKETGKPVYEALLSVEEETGLFQTHTLLKIEGGKSYLANGFVTATE